MYECNVKRTLILSKKFKKFKIAKRLRLIKEKIDEMISNLDKKNLDLRILRQSTSWCQCQTNIICNRPSNRVLLLNQKI